MDRKQTEDRKVKKYMTQHEKESKTKNRSEFLPNSL